MKENDLKKREKKSMKHLMIATGLVFLLLFLAVMFNVRLKTVIYTIDSDKMHKPILIGLITDLHSCEYGEKQKILVNEINRNKPDVILLGGDIFDDKIGDDHTIELLDEITKNYSCYYVTGNHEFWSGRIDRILQILESYQVKVLRGVTDVIEVRGEKISISGIDDPEYLDYQENESGQENESDQDNESEQENESEQDTQLQKISKEIDNQNFTILLAHRPSYVKTYMEYGFDLVLSGHAHGGQWRFPGAQNGLFAPDEEWFPTYSGGEYDFPGGKMIVSRGLARESTRIPRIFNRPEMVFIKIQ